MSDEPFLKRWANLKARHSAHGERERPPESVPSCDGASHRGAEAEREPLPSLDALGRDSDYRVFLERGVDRVLRNAALRRAWETDEAVSGFRGMAEYDWDFNAPGYGALKPQDLLDAVHEAAAPPSDPVAASVAEARDDQSPAETAPEPAAALPDADPPAEPSDRADAGASDPPAAVGRRHGGALPG